MRLTYLSALVGVAAVSALLTSCSKKDPIEYKLSAEQLAWQPYRVGDVLRFGHVKDSQVRTYRITEVQDRMEKEQLGINWTPFPSREPSLLQHVTVLGQRTDSTASVQQVLDLELYSDPTVPLTLRAEASWELFLHAPLPIDAVNAGSVVDTTLHPGVRLLPQATLGPTAYAQVIRATNQYLVSSPGSKSNRRLYYARGKGVVAFEEDGTGLWYRLPSPNPAREARG